MKKSDKKIDEAIYNFYESVTNNEKRLEDIELKLLGWEMAVDIYKARLNQINQREISSDMIKLSECLELSRMLCSAQKKAAVLTRKRFKLGLVIAKSRDTQEKIFEIIKNQEEEEIPHE